MTTHSAAADDDELLLVQFMDEPAERLAAALEEYVRRAPHLTERLHALARTKKALSESKPDAEPPVPERLGEFRIVRCLARGGMGEIYEAVQEPLGRSVAVKTIRRGHLSPLAEARFLREQKVLADLHQTHIVPIHTAGREGELQYFAMPYIKGATLRTLIERAWVRAMRGEGARLPALNELADAAVDDPASGDGMRAAQSPAPPTKDEERSSTGEEGRKPNKTPGRPEARSQQQVNLARVYFQSVARVMADAAGALAYAHDVGVLHRDIKPSNLMVDGDGQCWLIDFGLARYFDGRHGGEESPEGAELLTDEAAASGVLGTPQYMAPEQFNAKVDRRTDVWGLGVTFYELLTLRPAFAGGSAPELCRRIQTADPTPPRALARNVPADLAAICLKALRKEPGLRYPTAREFNEDLRRWLRGEPTLAGKARTPRRVVLWARRNTGWATAISAIVLILVGLVVAGFVYQRMDAEVEIEKSRTAEQRTQERMREAEMQKFQHLRQQRLLAHTGGWSEKARKLVREIGDIRASPELQQEAAATLEGLDVVPVQHFKDVQAWSVAFDREGRRVLIGGVTRDPQRGFREEPTKIWNGATQTFQAFPKLGSGLVAFGNDGTALQLVDQDRRSFALWDVTQQKKVSELTLPDLDRDDREKGPMALCRALSGDGTLAAASVITPAKTGKVIVWETATGRKRHVLDQAATDMKFSPDQRLLAVGDEAGQVSLWSLRSGTRLMTLPNGRTTISALVFSPDAKQVVVRASVQLVKGRLAVGDLGGLITIWDLALGKVLATCNGSVGHVYALAFSPDRTLLASGGRGHTHLWDAATGQLLLSFDSGDMQLAIAFSPDGNKLASGGRHGFSPGQVYVWELQYGRGQRTLRGLLGQVAKVAFSPDGTLLAASSRAWQLGVWDVATGRLRLLLEVPAGDLHDNAGLAISPDNRHLAFATYSAAESGMARMWDLGTGEVLHSWALPPGMLDELAFHPSGKLLSFRMETQSGKHFPAGRDAVSPNVDPRVVRIRNLLGPKPTEPIAPPITDFNANAIRCVAAPDGSQLAVYGWYGPDRASRRQRFRVYDGTTGRMLWSDTAAKAYGIVGLDPSGKILAIHKDDVPYSDLVAIATGAPLGTVTGLTALGPGGECWCKSANGLAVHRRGRPDALVTLGIDADICSIPTCQFNAAGTHLAWGNTDGTVTVCDLKAVNRQLRDLGLAWDE